MSVPRTTPRLSHEQFWEYYSNSFCCSLVNLCETDFLSKWTIRAACTSSSHVVHVAAPRVHDPLELCHVIGLKIWVNICPPSFLIVRPMRKLPRPVPSAILSIHTFYASTIGLLWNINCRRTDLTCQRSLFVEPRAWRFDSDNINDGISIYSNTFIVWTFELSVFSLKNTYTFRLQAQEIISVPRTHPPNSKTVSRFFIFFKFLIELSVSFLDSDLWSLISETALNVLRVLDCFLLNNYCLIRLGVVYACFWYKFWVFRYTK